jgi:hypothetical protein
MVDTTTEDCDHNTIRMKYTGDWKLNAYHDHYECVDCGKELIEKFTSDGFHDESGVAVDLEAPEIR